jgi:hypothetical protein
MSYLPFLMLLYIWFAISIRSFSSTPNPLNGQHLRVIWVKEKQLSVLTNKFNKLKHQIFG